MTLTLRADKNLKCSKRRQCVVRFTAMASSGSRFEEPSRVEEPEPKLGPGASRRKRKRIRTQALASGAITFGSGHDDVMLDDKISRDPGLWNHEYGDSNIIGTPWPTSSKNVGKAVRDLINRMKDSNKATITITPADSSPTRSSC